MYVKIHKSIRTVVALCDADLIGKKLEEGKKQMDIRENFFKGDKINEEQAINLLKTQAREDATFNIVGKKSVESAIKAGIITSKGVAKIKEVPFALILM